MRNNKKLESFSFGYGNNDYLSDLGEPDFHDKRGATALQPDQVGTQLGLVNEFSINEIKKLKEYRNQINNALTQLNELGFSGADLYSSQDSISDASKSVQSRNDIDIDEDLEYSRVDNPTSDSFQIGKEINELKKYRDQIEEILKKEGVGDKYLHKREPGRFPEDEFSDFESEYLKGDDKGEVVYFDKTGYKIIKNPEKPDNLGSGVRGVVLENGDFYVENEGVGNIHVQIIKILKDIGVSLNAPFNSWWEITEKNFITVQRELNTKKIFIGESEQPFIYRQKREKVRKIAGEMLKKAKQKNPNFIFINDRSDLYHYGVSLWDEKIDEERKKTYMDGSVGVDVKKQCRLGGLGSTSKACNQGDVGNLNFKKINEAKGGISELKDLPFKDDVMALDGEIYSVGGAVRDELLGRESKDLDILITGIPLNDLKKILSQYGKVSLVGESFGVLKFIPHNSKEEIDITIPRKERPTGGGGHKDFDVQSDHTLSIEDDLIRRDLTINAIAKDIHGNYIDPYGGVDDIKSGTIKHVNSDAFSDDPLRMLRAVQFSARFGFNIDEETLELIRKNAHQIKKEPKERILEEFNKIITKGNPLKGAMELKRTGLYKNIFDKDAAISSNLPWDNVKNLGDFIYLLTHRIGKPSLIYQNKLQTGDSEIFRYLKALEESENAVGDKIKDRVIGHRMYSISPESLKSGVLNSRIKKVSEEFLLNKYPKRIKDLEINGNDLISLGYKQDAKLGLKLKEILVKVYSDELRNNRNELIKYVKSTN